MTWENEVLTARYPTQAELEWGTPVLPLSRVGTCRGSLTRFGMQSNDPPPKRKLEWGTPVLPLSRAGTCRGKLDTLWAGGWPRSR